MADRSHTAGAALTAIDARTAAKSARLSTTERRPVFIWIILALTTLVALLVVYPLLRLILRGVQETGAAGVAELVSQPWFPTLLRDSIAVTVLASVLAVVLATLLAWINERTDATLGAVGSVLPLIPLFLPSVAMAIGWVMLAAPKTGFLNGLVPGIPEDLQLNIYSMGGLVFVYMLTLVPYAYLPISAAFRTIDLSREEAARVSGAGSVRVFFNIALRSVAPAVAGAFVVVAIVAFALYSVPVVIATRADIDIISVRLVRAVTQVYPADLDTALGLSFFMFVAMVLLWVVQQRVLSAGRFTRVGERTEGAARTRLGGWKWLARALVIGYVLASSVLPVVALLLVSFQTYWNPAIFGADYTLENYATVLGNRVARQSLENSLVLGILVGIATVISGITIVLFREQTKNRFVSRAVDAVAKIAGVVSSTVLGVAFILAFAGPPFYLGSTVWILVIAYLVVFLPHAVINLESSRAQIHGSLTEASEVSGSGRWRTVRTVILPLMIPGIFATWALLFVLMTGELSLAVLLSTPRTPVVGLQLRDYWEQGSFTNVAVLSVLMTAIAAVVVGVLLWLGRPRYARRH
jgi:iron(III) transport system permease protein